MLYGYFQIKANRDLFINKIDENERLEKKYDIVLDKEKDKRHKEVLSNWRNLTSKERLAFCEEVSIDAKSNDNSIKVVADKKTEIDNILQNSKNNIKDKIKNIVKEIGK